jgi:hypothetical protein
MQHLGKAATRGAVASGSYFLQATFLQATPIWFVASARDT